MVRRALRFYVPAAPREMLRRAELVPRWGVTGLVLFLLAVAPPWPAASASVVDLLLVLQTLLACSGLFFATGAIVISVASVRPGRRR